MNRLPLPALAPILAALLLAAPAPGAGEEAERAVVPPKLVQFVEAEYPPSEVASQQNASVLLQIAIDANGQVVEVAVLESASPPFDEAAVVAVKGFVFEPATVDGKPIPVKLTYRYDFVWKAEYVRKSTADFVGVVIDRFTKEPVPGVLVDLGDGDTRTTDEAGRFEFIDLQPGARTVMLSAKLLTPVGTEEELEAGKKLDAIYEVETKDPDEEDDADFEIVVTAPRIQKQVISTEVLADKAKMVPGTSGDVLKVVENLPGVGRAAAGSGALVVWGAAPQDTRVYVDGLRIPRLYHDGGYRSVLGSDLVRSVELIPGGYGAAYGRGLGGIVAVQMTPLDEEGFHGSVAADAIDASGSVRVQLGEKLNLAVAARKSWLDRVLAQATEEDVGDIVPIPEYHDGQARMVYRPNGTETWELGGMLSSDRTDRSLVNSDPALTTRETRGLDFYRLYAKYMNKMENGTVVSVVPFFGTDENTLVSRFGSTPTELTSEARLFGLRASWRSPLSPSVTVDIGADADVVQTRLVRSGSIGAPPREGDRKVFGQPPPPQINADDWETTVGSVAPYVEVDFGLFDGKVHVIPGLRLEPYFVTASRSTPKVGDIPSISTSRQDFAVDPRLALRWAPTEALFFKAAAGVYHQPPLSEDLSSVFGSPPLGPSRAEHYLAGVGYQLTGTLDVELTGFLSFSEDLAARSTLESPALAEALVQSAEGRVRGLQVMLRQKPIGPFFGWVSYSLLKSERKDAPDADWRLFDYDQTHVLTALGSFDLGAGFQAGGRFRFASGFPRTDVTGAYYDASTGLYQPTFGETNGIRIPPFVSLDLRISKNLKLGDGDLELYLDVQNVTDHENPEEIVYDPTYTRSDYITGFPTLPVLGAKWAW